MRLFLPLILLVVACDRAPQRRFALGPSCTHTYYALHKSGQAVNFYTFWYPDCTRHNIDSLRARGVKIDWDTTWADSAHLLVPMVGFGDTTSWARSKP